MVELVLGQTPFPMVHSNTFTPTPNAVIPVVSKFGEVIVPAPDNNVHVPVPIAAVLPAMFAVVNAQIV